MIRPICLRRKNGKDSLIPRGVLVWAPFKVSRASRGLSARQTETQYWPAMLCTPQEYVAMCCEHGSQFAHTKARELLKEYTQEGSLLVRCCCKLCVEPSSPFH